MLLLAELAFDLATNCLRIRIRLDALTIRAAALGYREAISCEVRDTPHPSYFVVCEHR